MQRLVAPSYCIESGQGRGVTDMPQWMYIEITCFAAPGVPMAQCTLRSVFLAILVSAVGLGWWFDHRSMSRQLRTCMAELRTAEATLRTERRKRQPHIHATGQSGLFAPNWNEDFVRKCDGLRYHV